MNEYTPPFRLTDAEKSSLLWLRLCERFDKRIAQLHRELETDLTESETATKRGHIKALREQLALNKELLPVHQDAQ